MKETPFLALKRHKNTKDILVRSKFETNNQWIVTNNGKLNLIKGAMVDWDATLLGAANTQRHSGLCPEMSLFEYRLMICTYKLCMTYHKKITFKQLNP